MCNWFEAEGLDARSVWLRCTMGICHSSDSLLEEATAGACVIGLSYLQHSGGWLIAPVSGLLFNYFSIRFGFTTT